MSFQWKYVIILKNQKYERSVACLAGYAAVFGSVQETERHFVMGLFRTKISPVERELQKIEREEQKLIQYAEKHITAPFWKAELENRVPEKVVCGLQKENRKNPFRSRWQ